MMSDMPRSIVALIRIHIIVSQYVLLTAYPEIKQEHGFCDICCECFYNCITAFILLDPMKSSCCS